MLPEDRDDSFVRAWSPGPKGIVAIITLCGPCAGHLPRQIRTAITLGIARAGALYCGKGVRATNTVYAIILILAAAAVVTVAFWVVTDLTP